MTRKTDNFAVFGLFVLFAATPVAAQTQQTDPLIFTADAGVVHQSDADLTDDGGGFSLDRWFVSAGMDYSWNLRNSIGFSVGGGNSTYNFDGTGRFGGGDPWNKVEDTRAWVTWRFGFGKSGSFTLIPTMRFNGESSVSSGDGRTYGLYAAAAWRISENLTIGPGFGVFSRLGNGARIFPILAIEWDISDRWNLSTGRGLAASQGPGLTLSYKLNEDWTLGVAGRYEYIEFRLDDAGAVPGGVGRDESLPLVFTATLKPSQRFSVSVFAGIEPFGTLTIMDAQGEFVDESSYDPAPIFGAALDIRF